MSTRREADSIIDDRLPAWLVVHAALLFLVGLGAGFPWGFFEIGKIALWPLVGDITVAMPGSTRAWRMAHLEGILNGLMLFAVAAIAPLLRLRGREPRLLVWSLIITGWGNELAALIGPLSGGRGLEFGGGIANSVMYLLFVVAVITVILAMLILLRGALRRTKTDRPSH